MTQKKTEKRSAGILLHPTSLPSPWGIGDFGNNAYYFVDFLKEASQEYWQILPLGPTGFGDCPYQSLSAFAGNPLLISPEKINEFLNTTLIPSSLIQDALKKIQDKRKEKNIPIHKVDYPLVNSIKHDLFLVAFHNAQEKYGKTLEKLEEFHSFVKENDFWIKSFALFMVFRSIFSGKPWNTWPGDKKKYTPSLIETLTPEQKDLYLFHLFLQWIFFLQWNSLHSYANQKGIKIIGDMPIFVSYDSADVWAYPHYFLLNQDGSLKVQAGVPPDYFSKTGQLWGNPLYNWDALKKENFEWFVRRFQVLLRLVDMIRIDHFRGFEAYWEIPGNADTAIHGRWVKAPGRELFLLILNKLGHLPLIAEDLGLITKEVEELRDYFGFPGMKVLQFAFGGDSRNPHLPHNYIQNCIAYTGTHDNNTTRGWWEKEISENIKNDIQEYFYLSKEHLEKHIVDVFIRAVFRSVANIVIIPIQDWLNQGTDSRMNTPGTSEGNWQYFMGNLDFRSPFIKEIANKIHFLSTLYGRN